MTGNRPPENRLDPDGAAVVRSSGSTHNSQPPPVESTSLDGSFGVNLEPVLLRACHGQLSNVTWFRTDWQRGGALTGYATFRDDGGGDRPAVVKLPIPPIERLWLSRLQDANGVAPVLYAHGDALNGYDMAWAVMERLAHGPLGSAWGGQEFDLLTDAAGRFYQAATEFPVDQPPPQRNWQQVFELSRKNVKRHGLRQEQRWTKALKQSHRKLKQWQRIWDDRNVDHWCHGDLHLGNAMTRHPAPQGPALLLDFALTRPGHWLEDAVYFEHLYWSRPDALGSRRLCRQIAHERKRLGLAVDKDWPRLAEVKRALLAMSTPAMLHLDGDPRHVEAALHVLEANISA